MLKYLRFLRDVVCRRDYLLFDGMNSCCYIPRHTYNRMNRMLVREVSRNSDAENSLRFLWTMIGGEAALVVNPVGVEMIRTHGLTRSTAGNIVIPCPYIQYLYEQLCLPPEYCGRLYVRNDNGNEDEKGLKALAVYRILKEWKHQ